ncbi:MAG: tetratricopeptide repeat protein [Treponema sp.]|nr:tetratricopeptide repeat protein [Treponema sp.]
MDYESEAMDLIGQGNYDGAIAAATRAISDDPKTTVGYGIRAMAYSKKNDYDSAIADNTKQITLTTGENRAGCYYSRGGNYLGKGDDDKAIADYKMAADLGLSRALKKLEDMGVKYNPKGDSSIG